MSINTISGLPADEVKQSRGTPIRIFAPVKEFRGNL
jgi:hypothetical protein